MNKLFITGNLGRDAELRYSPSGEPVVSFSVASTKKYKTSGGEQKEETLWVKCALWGARSEKLNPYLLQGQKVFVEGELIPDANGGCRVWTDKEGNPRASFEIRVRDIELLGGKKQAESTETE
jgi:single-strand DNA-binding protein